MTLKYQFRDPAEFVEFDCRGCVHREDVFGVHVCTEGQKRKGAERRCLKYSKDPLPRQEENQ